MENQTKTTQQLKRGQLVFVHPTKQKGKLINVKGDKAIVEIITNRNEVTKERTTIAPEFKLSDISPYREKKYTQTKKYNPNEMYYMVQAFHKAFNHPISNKPKPLSPERATSRAVWTGEELVEFIHASSHNLEQFEQLFDVFIQGLYKAKEKSIKSDTPKTDIERIVAQADALTDVEYFNQGSFVEMGVKPFNLFKIVQEANMGKLHDGKPKYRDGDGKIMKPDNWERDYAPEPRLKKEIERQSK